MAITFEQVANDRVVEITQMLEEGGKAESDALTDGQQLLRLRDLLDEAQGHEGRASVIAFTYMACGLLFFVILLVSLIRQKTTISYCAQFGFELERFMNRIQGLASKSELAELVRLEVGVTDEATAKLYVEHVEVIARRHGVDSLVKEIRLWDRHLRGDAPATSAEGPING